MLTQQQLRYFTISKQNDERLDKSNITGTEGEKNRMLRAANLGTESALQARIAAALSPPVLSAPTRHHELR